MILRTASLWGESSRTLVEDLVQVTYLKLWEGGCRLLRDFAVERPEAILGYLKKNGRQCHARLFQTQPQPTCGGELLHVSTDDVDPEAGREVHGSEAKIEFSLFWRRLMST